MSVVTKSTKSNGSRFETMVRDLRQAPANHWEMPQFGNERQQQIQPERIIFILFQLYCDKMKNMIEYLCKRKFTRLVGYLSYIRPS